MNRLGKTARRGDGVGRPSATAHPRPGRPIRLALYLGLLAALGAALVARGRWEAARRVQEHDRLAKIYFDQGKLDAAVLELRREITLSPRRESAYYNLGIIELQRGHYQEAREALGQAVALGAEQPQIQCALGLAAFRMADYSAAVAPLQQCLARNPDDDEARYLLAQALLGQARLDEAEQSFNELLRRQPSNSRFLYALGTVYLTRPATPANNAAALAALRRAVAVADASPGAYYSLGLIYRRMGRAHAAASALEQALRRDPRMLEARRTLGLVYRQLGREAEATAQFRAARTQWPPAYRDQRESYLRSEAQRNAGPSLAHFRLDSPPEALQDATGAVVSDASRQTVQFSDVTEKAGLRFRHTNGGVGQKYLPETMGSGCAFLDADGDGWLDVLLLNGRPLRHPAAARPGSRPLATPALYRNNRDGTFTDITRGSGLDVPLYAMGCCVGDYDNDGRDDLFITTCLEPNRLFHNEGGGRFRDVTETAGVGDRRWSTSCAWVDYDNDGWLDLFVCNYLRYRSIADDRFCSLVAHRKSYCPPTAYEGESCILYHNSGDGSFRDVSRQTGIARHVGNSLGVALLDFDHDGWMDIAVANDETPNYLFHNIPALGSRLSALGEGGGMPPGRMASELRGKEPRAESREPRAPRRGFEEIGVETGFAVSETGKPKAGMGIDAADYRNDGTVGILVSNFSNEGLSFYRQEGHLFSEVAFAVGFGEPSLLTLGFGLLLFDVDNDGLKDAFVANGHINDDIRLVQSNVTYAERPLLFRNRGGGRFEEVGRGAGTPFAAMRVSRGAACGDYDNDGDLDLLISNNNGPAELLRNDGPGVRNWLQIEVRGRGAAGGTNRSGIGARVRVKAGGTVQTDWVRSGSSYLSQSMLRRHFGLGAATKADEVEVRWPSGIVDRLRNIPANRRLTVVEGAGR